MKKCILSLAIALVFFIPSTLRAQPLLKHESIMTATSLVLDSSYHLHGTVKFQLEGSLADSLRKSMAREGKFAARVWVTQRFPGYEINKMEVPQKEAGAGKLDIHCYLTASKPVNINEEESEIVVPAFMGYHPYILNLEDSLPDAIYSELMVFQLNMEIPVSRAVVPSQMRKDGEEGCLLSFSPLIGGGMFRVLGKIGYIISPESNCREEIGSDFSRLEKESFRLEMETEKDQ